MLLNTVIGTAFVLSRYALAYPQASPAADPVITKPDFTSHFLGDERGDVKDDQDLVNLEGGNRRLRKLEIWCGPSVNQMIPTYSNKAGTDHKAWPWGSLARGGSYLSMDINPGETIQYLKLERCNIGGTSLETADWRICFFHATKGPISGGPSKDPNSEIKCGFSQGIRAFFHNIQAFQLANRI